MKVTYFAYCVAVRGDWKFLKETFHFKRHYNTVNLCWMCLASKSAANEGYLYTNFKRDCLWRSSMYVQDPWVVPSVLMQLHGFNIRMIKVDLLHVFYLGVGRDMLGSVLKLLVQKNGFFVGRTIADRMKSATSMLKGFCRTQRKSVRFRNFSRKRLKWKSSAYPELKCKASDVSTTLAWLAYTFEHTVAPSCYDDLGIFIWAANTFCKVFVDGQDPLSDDDRALASESLKLFINLYLTLARDAFDHDLYLWKIRPKFHLLCHLQIQLEEFSVCRNPKAFATWMDEDMVKNIMRVKAKTHKTTSTVRTLQRYVAGLKIRLLKLVGGQKN